ncbi:MAG: RNA methyltransferase [Kiritimatiellaeota bacterium]|nr:RNA methyltransferase [Kiritimatiellota bacterium]
MNAKQKIWQDALTRLRALDAAWADEAQRHAGILDCKDWMAAQEAVPRLAALARQMTPGMSRCQFWCVLVPVEREVSRCKVTDIDILDHDLPPDAPAAAQVMPVTVVLDCIRSAFNVGGIFRSAECFGVAEIILCGYTPLPTQTQVARVALGTERSVAWRHAEDIRQAIASLKAQGIRCYALETVANATDIGATAWQFPCALILGNERFGLDAETVAACDAIVRIPCFGRKNSLNVVSAFTVAAYEARRKFG